MESIRLKADPTYVGSGFSRTNERNGYNQKAGIHSRVLAFVL